VIDDAWLEPGPKWLLRDQPIAFAVAARADA
jgi:hypothetical protein